MDGNAESFFRAVDDPAEYRGLLQTNNTSIRARYSLRLYVLGIHPDFRRETSPYCTSVSYMRKTKGQAAPFLKPS